MGVFWHNAAETWIDITNAAANKVCVDNVSSIIKLFFLNIPSHPILIQVYCFDKNLNQSRKIYSHRYFFATYWYLPVRIFWGSCCRTSRQTMKYHRLTLTGCQRAASLISSSSSALGLMTSSDSTPRSLAHKLSLRYA